MLERLERPLPAAWAEQRQLIRHFEAGILLSAPEVSADPSGGVIEVDIRLSRAENLKPLSG
jgi:hypothetical protein